MTARAWRVDAGSGAAAGVRADERPRDRARPAIFRDMAELYGGSIALSASPSGGLRASLQRLPG
jgi:hypothetical protein